MSLHGNTSSSSGQSGNGKLTKFTRGVVCPICGGCENDPRGEGKRCWGFTDGHWCHCTRPELANGCDYHEKSQTFSHNLSGKCKCGVQHGPAPEPSSNGNGNLGEIECVYPYHDTSGTVIHETVRYRLPDGDKKFKQRQPNGHGGYTWSLKGVTPVLYRLPDLIAAPIETPVWICEGEKDVDSLRNLGLTATTNPMGAEKWRPAYSDMLKGRICRIIPDNDEKGRRHARQVAQSLAGKAMSIQIIDLPCLPEKGDVSDWLAARHTIQELNELAEQNPVKVETHPEEPLLQRDGRWTSCLKNSEIWLLRQPVGGHIRYDTFRQTIIIDDKLISDELIILFKAMIESETRTAWSSEHVREAMILIASANQFSSLTEWLDALVWDGEYRLNRFFTEAYGCIYESYVGECARVLFLSAVARAYKPGCQADVMVVLIGPQGAGKSMGIASLAPKPEWYADDLGCDLTEGKAGEGLQGKWLFEFSEFARVNRATLDTVKSFVSRRVDHYRPPYGRISRDFPRSCVFVGTTNDPHPLRDTENRRFMPIVCNQGNIKWITENRDQIWAEAVHRFKLGERWWVNDPEIAASCASKQEAARMDDAWETILDERLDGYTKITMNEAADKLDIKVDKLDKSMQIRIGLVLNSIGFKRKRIQEDGKRGYHYVRTDAPCHFDRQT